MESEIHCSQCNKLVGYISGGPHGCVTCIECQENYWSCSQCGSEGYDGFHACTVSHEPEERATDG